MKVNLSEQNNDFFQWLQPRLKDEYYHEYKDLFIELSKYCFAKEIILCPLIEVRNQEEIKNIEFTVAQSTEIRKQGKNKVYMYGLILRLYSKYLSCIEMTNQPRKNDFAKKKISERNEKKEAQLDNSPVILLNNKGNINDALPDYFEYSGKKRTVTSWVDLIIKVCSLYNEIYPEEFQTLIGTSIVGCSRVEIGQAKNYMQMKRPRIFAAGKYVETQMSPLMTIEFIKFISKRVKSETIEICLEYPEKNIPQEKVNSSVESNQTVNIQSQETKKGKNYLSHDSLYSIEKGFVIWMKNSQKMAESTQKTYISSIKTAERYAKKHISRNSNLFSPDLKASEATIHKLLANDSFQEYNKMQYYRFTVALEKLLKYIAYEKNKRGRDSQQNHHIKSNISAPINQQKNIDLKQQKNTNDVVELVLTDYSMHGSNTKK